MSETDSIYSKYVPVIGLEVHAQLLTKSKAYCADKNEFGSEPNTLVGPLSLGHPGTLPKHNKEAIQQAVKVGIATHCQIRENSYYARKNYFYADLPKGYQITQDKTPICTKGFLTIKLKDGTKKNIGITRIHMEEDAGKSLHDQDVKDTLIDLNRAGVPLIEIVSEPEIANGDEAYAYISEIRKLLRYLDVCDGNMEEGSLRCDANISVMLKGSNTFGTKVEVKNMNSISNVKRAIDVEIKRQIDLLESGQTFTSETRGFDALQGVTFSQRSKELANDYRYFPEPDLPPVVIHQTDLEKIKAQMPSLPEELFEKYHKQFGLSEYDAQILTENKETAAYFESVLTFTSNKKAAANWVMVNIKGYLNENALELKDFGLTAQQIAGIINLIDEGKISNSIASQQLFPALLQNPSETAASIAERLNLLMQSDSNELEKIIDELLQKNPAKVAEYKSGKKGIAGMFMGDIMKATHGKADPKIANQLINKKLNA